MTNDLIPLLMEVAAAHPEHTAVRHGGTALTYGQLRDTALAFAAALKDRGATAEDTVLLAARVEAPEAAALVLGAIAAGCSIAYAPASLPAEEMARRADAAAPTIVIADEASARAARQSGRKGWGALRGPGGAPVRHIHVGRRTLATPFASVPLRKALRTPPLEAAVPDASARIIDFTADGGTVEHSRASLGSTAEALAQLSRMGRRSVVLTSHFVAGFAALSAGAVWEIPTALPERLGAPRWAAEAARIQPTHVYLSPEGIAAVLDDLGNRRSRIALRGWTEFLTRPAGATEALRARFAEQLPGASLTAYHGLAEVMPASAEDAGEILYPDGDIIAGVILGVPADTSAPGARAAVLSGDGSGEVRAIRPPVRAISRRGETFRPERFEESIRHLAGVAECVLVGLPDAAGDDLVVLAVSPAEGAGHVRRLRGRIEAHLLQILDPIAQPDAVLVMPGLPRTAHGDIDRERLVADLANRPEVAHALTSTGDAA